MNFRILLLIIFVVMTLVLIYSYQNAKSQTSEETKSFYDESFEVKDIDGSPIDFQSFKGKKLLIVNVASKCGFTPQYETLQELHEKYQDQLTIIGLPCNQFANQEPGSLEEIKEFCSLNFGVTFLMTEKVDVKGENQHPIYQWLTNKEKNGLKSSTVKWNFQKYLLDENGHLIDVFYSMTKPMSPKITNYLSDN